MKNHADFHGIEKILTNALYFSQRRNKERWIPLLQHIHTFSEGGYLQKRSLIYLYSRESVGCFMTFFMLIWKHIFIHLWQFLVCLYLVLLSFNQCKKKQSQLAKLWKQNEAKIKIWKAKIKLKIGKQKYEVKLRGNSNFVKRSEYF